MERDFTEGAIRLAGFAGIALGWSPDAFWRATPAELAATASLVSGEAVAVPPPDRDTLARLMREFPDG